MNARHFRIAFTLVAGLWLGAVAAPLAAEESVLDSVPSLDVLTRRLELTDAQKAQLTPIFQQRLSELQTTQSRFQQAVSKQEKKGVLRDAKKGTNAFNAQVESVLTPSQKSEWREFRKETREKVKERYERKREEM